MNLIKTCFLTGISTFIKILSGFIVNKILAVYVGPAGIALIGQFQNFITTTLSLSNGAINNGIVKYTAEYANSDEKRSDILKTAMFITLICSLIASVTVILLHNQLSLWLLKSNKYSSVFLIFGFTLIIYSINSYFISILNGLREIRKYIVINILSSLFSLLFSALLVIYAGLYGALLSLATSQTLVFGVTLFFTRKCAWFNIKNFVPAFEQESFKNLLKFSLMTAVTALSIPTSQIIIRNYIIHSLSLDAAGFWQGVIKISDVYLLIITTSLTIYYLPRLSEITKAYELKKEIAQGYKTVMPLVIALAAIIFFNRELIIKLLFTEEFLPMKNLFLYQLTGDIFKIATWLLASLMIAKAMVKRFIYTEIIFSISLVLFSVIFINKFGLIGATQAFALNYFLGFIIMLWLFRDIIKAKEDG